MDITFEPDMVSILKNIIPPYINASILASLVETTLSEYSARRVAMENAKNNGEELLEILSIEYNKARQQKITQELTEIIAGAEAEKEN
jgi:F-type H+-transporting ATPase subunit gamma